MWGFPDAGKLGASFHWLRLGWLPLHKPSIPSKDSSLFVMAALSQVNAFDCGSTSLWGCHLHVLSIQQWHRIWLCFRPCHFTCCGCCNFCCHPCIFYLNIHASEELPQAYVATVSWSFLVLYHWTLAWRKESRQLESCQAGASRAGPCFGYVEVNAGWVGYTHFICIRMVVRIMLMVPLYAVSSLISLFSLEAAFVIDAIRDIYEVCPTS